MSVERKDSDQDGTVKQQDRFDDLESLRLALREFVDQRAWHPFHTPKNLASALSVEASELLEPFQWLQHGRADELGEAGLRAVKHEMADVLNYLVMLADKLDVDLLQATREKIALNAIKYPVEKAFGTLKKYDQL
ncbi:nucleotide pyrophosphohydrolase [Undibacterium cyanobacteriorum]|uniref:Nucleotide pyrophosphohydrolase n=1 Tax=Undibacterium cyanobacteriorum TaxID=3073561 RepID=A0ABY9RKX3_9BURK|nr:nucleotide pyrophosphohydrolase [Undibacterium sp. 20NA77.5]WMW81601.1 nucleotide pyrophosphohydrolase [Undibacterium sp. 20NA77.5]